MELWEELAYKRVAAAICAEACNDYIKNTIKLKHTTDKTKEKQCNQMIKECLDFFYSDRFRILSTYEGSIEDLLNRLDYLAEQEKEVSVQLNDNPGYED